MTKYQARQRKLRGKPLGKREGELWSYMAQGFSSGQIARKMRIALNTVYAMKKNIYAKLVVHNIAAAVARWYERNR